MPRKETTYQVRKGRRIVGRGRTNRPSAVFRRYMKIDPNFRIFFMVNGRYVEATDGGLV